MSASNKLIELYKTEPLLKGITLTEKNIKDAVFYVDEISNCQNCPGLSSCKNKIKGIQPEFNGESITYKSCSYALIEEKKRITAYREGLKEYEKRCRAYLKEHNKERKNLTSQERGYLMQ